MRRWPAPTTVIALVALFVALGGGAYAAFTLPKASVGTRELQEDAVRGKNVADGSLRRRHFRPGVLPLGEAVKVWHLGVELTEEPTSVIALSDQQDPIAIHRPSRIMATGTAVIRNSGTASPVAECEIVTKPTDGVTWSPVSFPSWENLEAAEPGTFTYATVPVTGNRPVEPASWDVALRCRNTVEANTDLEATAVHLNVIVLPLNSD